MRRSEGAANRMPVIHPFLFSAFPVLALYAYNAWSFPVSVKEFAGPAAAAVAGTALVYLLLRVLLRSPVKAGLLASLLVGWFFSFGHIAGQWAAWTGGQFDRPLFVATALLTAAASFYVIRSRRTFAGLTLALNAAAVALMLFNFVSVGRILVRRPCVVPAPEIRVSGQPRVRPNIYFIVFDAYTRADVLREVFDFDNGPFLSGLESRGFTIAQQSYANYNFTYPSLASTLNFHYLDQLVCDVGETSSDRGPLYALIRRNRVMDFLRAQGYKLITVASSQGTGELKTVNADGGFPGLDSEFRTVLFNLTPLPLFIRPGRSGSFYDAHRRRILESLQALQQTPSEKGPFFLFVHVMSPHPPFVFGPDGQPAEPDYPFSMVDADRIHGLSPSAIGRYIRAYRDQLTFLNKKILETVDGILGRSPEPPIIIMQGDHGSRAFAVLNSAKDSYFKENLAIFSAYRLPAGGDTLVYPGISPVNTFRLILKHYFGADLEFLVDRSAWSTWRRPYQFLSFDKAADQNRPRIIRNGRKPFPPDAPEK